MKTTLDARHNFQDRVVLMSVGRIEGAVQQSGPESVAQVATTCQNDITKKTMTSSNPQWRVLTCGKMMFFSPGSRL